MMNETQKVFLNLIKDYINRSRSVVPTTVNWKKLYEYGEAHQLLAVIYQQTKDNIPDEYAELFRKSFLNTVYSNVQRSKVNLTVLSMLKENGIDCFLIKGFIIAEYYPNWQYRTMGDSDIVVYDLEKACQVLSNYGVENLSKTKDGEYKCFIKNMEFELHNRLVYDEAVNLESTTKFLNNYNDYVVDGKLDESFHFIFVLNHLRKHFMNSGVGFRQFVDIAFLINNNNKINWKWTEECLDELGLLPFTKTVFNYLERWFGIIVPFPSESVTEDIFEKSTNYIFDNGVFGFDNTDNKGYLASNMVRNSKLPKLSMIRMALGRVFPSYNSMINVDSYSYIKGKPLLLPTAWVFRFISGLKRKGIRRGINQIKDSFVSKTYIDKREEMFNNWRLC